MKSLKPFVCRIIDIEGKIRGTGFFILPEGYIVTCYHVVEACKGNVRVGIIGESEPLKSDVVREYEPLDIAVLKINRENCRFLSLKSEWNIGDPVFSHGFSIQHLHSFSDEGFPMESILTGTTTPKDRKTEVIVLEKTDVNHGLSGAPAFNVRTNEVIGIITLKYDDGRKALVVPIEQLFEKWADLKKYHESLQEKGDELPDIPPIESVLRKGETTDGDFFKKEPEWVDYEQGFIVERKEVDEIIKKIETNKVQLVLGAPASGKSIILKNVGFKLANQNKVYVVELKKHPQEEIKLFFENIPKIDDDNPIFIVDDAHLYLSECDRLIRNFKGRGKGKLIIGSRETEEITRGYPTQASEFEYLSKTAIKIRVEDVTEEIIKIFLESKHNLNDERIKTVSGSFDKFKKDLWYLSWALKAYKPDKETVEEDTIYEMIKERIKVTKAEDVFLPLSVFYRYEIPIERKFLVEQLGIKKEIIEQLIGLSEIVETEEKGKLVMLSLNHSSLAELYFGAYQNYPSLGEEIREIILNGKDEDYLEICLFYRYLTTSPINLINIILSLGREWTDENSGETLLKNLIEKDKIQKSFDNGIDKEQDIINVGLCVSIIANLNKELAIKLMDSVSARIEREEDIGKVGLCVSLIAGASRKTELKLLESININVLSSKIDKEEDIGKVGVCVSIIAGSSKEVALKLLESININVLSSKIDKEEDIEKVGLCVWGIAGASRETELKLLESININVLSSKIDKEENIEKIGSCVSLIAGASRETELKLLESININVLSSKIDKEENIEKVGFCVRKIAMVSEEVALKLLESININALSSKINKEDDIKNVGWCVWSIAWVNEEVAMKLADSININALSSKINKEEDIEKVGWCVSHIAEVSKEVALKLIDSVSAKIDKEEDIEKVGSCLSGIAGASKEVALKLADSIDINALSLEINKEEDIEKVGLCVWGIARVSQEVAMKLVDSIDINALSSKIDKEEDIGKVGSCIWGIAEVSKEVALKLVDSVSAKIDKEEDIEKIGSCVWGIARVSQEVAMKLVDSIDINALSSKIDNEEDIEIVRSCVWCIARASQEATNEIVNRLNPKLRKELKKMM